MSIDDVRSDSHAYGGLVSRGADVGSVALCGAQFPAHAPWAWASPPSCVACRRKLGLP